MDPNSMDSIKTAQFLTGRPITKMAFYTPQVFALYSERDEIQKQYEFCQRIKRMYPERNHICFNQPGLFTPGIY